MNQATRSCISLAASGQARAAGGAPGASRGQPSPGAAHTTSRVCGAHVPPQSVQAEVFQPQPEVPRQGSETRGWAAAQRPGAPPEQASARVRVPLPQLLLQAPQA